MTRSRLSLPVIQPASTGAFPRRRILLLGVAAVGVAACRADADIDLANEFGNVPPPPDDAGGDDATSMDPDAGNGPDVQSIDDMGTPPDDVTTPIDVAPPPEDATSPEDVPPPPEDVPPPPDVPATCTPGPHMLGAESSFPMGTWHLISSPSVIVGHDSGGLYAYSSVCTHSGCIVNAPASSGDATCHCHGSVFDGNGAVVNGPARTPLVHYAVTVCSDVVYVNTSMTVAASVRTAP